MAKATKPKTGKKDITLWDVVVNMQHMEQRLESKMGTLEDKMGTVESGLRKEMKDMEVRLTAKIDGTEKKLIGHIDGLGEDLTAVMQNTVKIRQFVRMPLPADE